MGYLLSLGDLNNSNNSLIQINIRARHSSGKRIEPKCGVHTHAILFFVLTCQIFPKLLSSYFFSSLKSKL